MKDAAQILHILPHKFPFLMLDRVLQIVPGKSAVGEKTITWDAASTVGADGRFPDILLIEAMAQPGAVAASGQAQTGPGPQTGTGYLAGITGAKFLKRPASGDKVLFKVEYEAKMGGLYRFRGEASIDGVMAAESTLIFTAPGNL